MTRFVLHSLSLNLSTVAFLHLPVRSPHWECIFWPPRRLQAVYGVVDSFIQQLTLDIVIPPAFNERQESQ